MDGGAGLVSPSGATEGSEGDGCQGAGGAPQLRFEAKMNLISCFDGSSITAYALMLRLIHFLFFILIITFANH